MIDLQRAKQVFTPNDSPSPEWFIGRAAELAAFRVLIDDGLYPMVMGARGVGKTSFARFAAGGVDPTFKRIGCNRQMTFNDLAHAILEKLGLHSAVLDEAHSTESSMEAGGQVFGIGAKAGGRQSGSVRKAGLASQTLNPWTLYEQITQLTKPRVLILDEFDRTVGASTNLAEGVADFLRTLGDERREHKLTPVLVGLQRSSQEWYIAHPSVRRYSSELRIPALDSADAMEFVVQAGRELGVTISHDVLASIVEDSGGFPYYVHLLGLETLRAAVRRDPTTETLSRVDYEAAIAKAVDQAFRFQLSAYKAAVPGKNSIGASIVEVLLSYSSSARMAPELLEREVSRRQDAARVAVKDEINRLCGHDGILSFVKDRNEIRFREPLLAPFLRVYFIPSERRIRSGDSFNQLRLFGE